MDVVWARTLAINIAGHFFWRFWHRGAWWLLWSVWNCAGCNWESPAANTCSFCNGTTGEWVGFFTLQLKALTNRDVCKQGHRVICQLYAICTACMRICQFLRISRQDQAANAFVLLRRCYWAVHRFPMQSTCQCHSVPWLTFQSSCAGEPWCRGCAKRKSEGVAVHENREAWGHGSWSVSQPQFQRRQFSWLHRWSDSTRGQVIDQQTQSHLKHPSKVF